jgi:hypothetical protein
MTGEVAEAKESEESVVEGEGENTAEAEAAFAAGFSKVAKNQTGVEEEEPEEEEPPKEVQKSDADRLLEKLPDRLSRIEGNIGGLKSQLNKALNDLNAIASRSTKSETPSKEEVSGALADPEAYKDLVEDYPKFASVLKQLEGLQKRIDGLSESAAPRQKEPETQPEVDVSVLNEKHSDWQETAKSEAFRTWALEGGPKFEDYVQVVQMGPSDPSGTKDRLLNWASEYPDWWKVKGKHLFGSKVDDSLALLDRYKQGLQEKEDTSKADKRRRLKSITVPDGSSGALQQSDSDEAAFARGFNRVIRHR